MTERTFVAALVAVLLSACAGTRANTRPTCGAGRTDLDGVCVSERVADYVSCVRAHGAALGTARADKLAADAKYAGAGASVASEVSEKLEKQYSTTEANELEVIRTCNAIHGISGSGKAAVDTQEETAVVLGAVVAARWTDGKWYLGRVEAVRTGAFDILYADGDRATVTAADVIRIPKSPNIEVGDHVLAVWKGAKIFPGKVIAKNGSVYTVQWDDGDTPLAVEAGRIVKF